MIAVQLTVHCDDQPQAVAAVETLSRTAVGVALDGRTTTLTIVTVDDEEDGE